MMPARPRLRNLAGEAWANVVAGRLLTVSMLLTVAVGFGLVGYLESRVADHTIGLEQQFRKSGGYISEIRVASDSDRTRPIDRTACERLVLLDRVVASGSVGTATDASLIASPDDSLGVVVASPGLAHVLDSTGPDIDIGPGDLIVSAGQFEVLELDPARHLAVGDLPPSEPIPIDLTTLAPGYSRAAITFGMTTGPATSCYVAIRPGSPPTRGELLAAIANPAAQVVPIVGDTVVEPGELWDARTERHLWWAAPVVILAMSLLGLWIRRGELALYRVFGLRRFDVRILVGIERMVMVLVGGAVGVAASVGASALAGHQPTAIAVGFDAAVSSLALALAVVPLSALVATRGSVVDHIKDR